MSERLETMVPAKAVASGLAITLGVGAAINALHDERYTSEPKISYGETPRQTTPLEQERHQLYTSFKYQDELPMILKHAERVGVDPALLLAIRSAENGRDALAYGIKPLNQVKERYDADQGYIVDGKFQKYTDEKEKQLCWAAWTLKKRVQEFTVKKSANEDLIGYVARSWAPENAKNDPRGRNKHWKSNVRQLYEKFSEEDGRSSYLFDNGRSIEQIQVRRVA